MDDNRRKHLKEIEDIRDIYKNIESDLNIELTDREKVIVSLLMLDYKGITITNPDQKISTTMYDTVRFNETNTLNINREIELDYKNKFKEFVKGKDIEVYVERSQEHVQYKDSTIYKIHIYGKTQDIENVANFFDLKHKDAYADREFLRGRS